MFFYTEVTAIHVMKEYSLLSLSHSGRQDVESCHNFVLVSWTQYPATARGRAMDFLNMIGSLIEIEVHDLSVASQLASA